MANGSFGVLEGGQRVDLPTQPEMTTGVTSGGTEFRADTSGPGMTPQSYLDDTLRSSLDAVQSRFNTQWETVQKNARYLGIDKANAMLQELHMSAVAEAEQLKVAAAQRSDMLQRLNVLGQQGQLGPDSEKMMWEAVAGKDVAESMFPEQARTPDPLSEFGKLTQQESRLQGDIEQFHVVPGGERVPSFWRPEALERRTTSKLQVFDPDVETRIKKGSKWVREIGGWVDSPAPVKDAQKLASLNKQLKLVRDAKQRLGESPQMSSRISRAAASLVTGENPSGTFGDKISASVVDRQSRRHGRKLDKEGAARILKSAGGDKDKARQLARQMGYEL